MTYLLSIQKTIAQCDYDMPPKMSVKNPGPILLEEVSWSSAWKQVMENVISQVLSCFFDSVTQHF